MIMIAGGGGRKSWTGHFLEESSFSLSFRQVIVSLLPDFQILAVESNNVNMIGY
jgi:hypothetical protein